MLDTKSEKLGILKSGSLVLVGSALNTALSFLVRIFLSRHLGSSGYGDIVVGITILTSLQMAALLGIDKGIARELPRLSANEYRAFVSSGLGIIILSSIGYLILSISFGEIIAKLIFKDAELSSIIRLFSAFIPLVAAMQYAIGVTRGLKLTWPRVFMASVIQPGVRVLLVGLVVALGLGTQFGAVAYVVPYLFCGALGLYYIYSKVGIHLSYLAKAEYKLGLIRFSLPIAASNAMMLVLINTDVYVIGHYLSTSNVGVYDIAYSLSKLIMPLLFAAEFLIMPTLSQLDSEEMGNKMNELYQFVVRLTSLVVIPSAAFLCLYSTTVLAILFGSEYTGGSTSMVILTTGFLFHVILGPNSEALTSIGSVDSIVKYSAVAATCNIVLNILLVPTLGIDGASTATAASYILLNTLLSSKLYIDCGIKPISKTLIFDILRVVTPFTISWIIVFQMSVSTLKSLITHLTLFSILYIVTLYINGDVQEAIDFVSSRAN